MRLQRALAAFWVKIRKLPRWLRVAIAVFLVAFILYGIVFFTEKPVVFSYGQVPCVKQLTLLPDLHKASNDTPYIARPSQVVRVGNMAIAARAMCFLPTLPPQKSVVRTSTAPFGGWLMRKTFVITADSPPVAQLSALNRPIASLKPLNIKLSTTDRVFAYYLRANNREVKCLPNEKMVSCQVEKLQLAHGASYKMQLSRQFGNKNVATLAAKKISTLPAVRITTASIRRDETVYSKPRAIDIKLDKKITKLALNLYRLKGTSRVPVTATTVVKDKSARINVTKDLPRSARYVLVAKDAEAVDGSGLERTYELPFKTSGGPKVTNISIGNTGVPLGSTAIITFDQPLSEKQDIAKAVKMSGGAVVSGVRGNQLFVNLGNVPKCGDFTIKITNALQSSYNITGNSAWSRTARMVCHTVSTIGYSVQGRPITAYYFGSGPTTVLYTGAIHGSEISTRGLMERWIAHLEANARSIPSNKTVVVVPQLNPDGVASGTRVNAHNVDLNRNFATRDWKKDTTTVENQPFPGGGGKSPMSEPETQAIAALAGQLRPALVLSYHSIGGVVVANQAGNSSAWAAMYAQQTGYGNATGQTDDTFEYAVSGTAEDWYAEKLGVPSLLIELSSHTYHQFERNQEAMWRLLKL